MSRFLPLLLLGLAAAGPLAAAPARLQVNLTDQKGGPVADAVVSLVPLDAPVPAADPAQVHEIMQRDEEFTPFVTVVQVGSTVVFPNRDRVQHHVYSLSKAKKFELPLYDPGQAERLVFDQPGLVTLGCNIHDWMLAYLVVVPTPYYVLTAASGSAALTAPPGRYRLEIWQPRQPTLLTREVALGPDETPPLVITLQLKPDRRIRRAPVAGSRGY
jgi:plastocyanin